MIPKIATLICRSPGKDEASMKGRGDHMTETHKYSLAKSKRFDELFVLRGFLERLVSTFYRHD